MAKLGLNRKILIHSVESSTTIIIKNLNRFITKCTKFNIKTFVTLLLNFQFLKSLKKILAKIVALICRPMKS